MPVVDDVVTADKAGQVSAEKNSDNKTSTAAPESQTLPEDGSKNEIGNVDAEIHCQ